MTLNLLHRRIGYLLFIACLTLYAISCSKSSSEQITGSCRMLSSSGSLNKAFYTYDENHKILYAMYIDPPNDTSWEKYHYIDGHVTFMIRIYRGTLGDTIFYTYDSGKYVEVYQHGNKQKYYYDNSGLLVKIERYDGASITTSSDLIYDSRGNCIRYIKYYKSGSTSTWEEIADFEYGDKRSPYSSIGLPPLNSIGPEVGQYLSPNNLTKMRIQFPQTNKHVFVYQYNAFNENGYPTSFSMGDSLNHIISNESIEYICP